jgi:hypothetical protein
MIKARTLLCAGLLVIVAPITIDVTGVMAEGSTQRSCSLPKVNNRILAAPPNASPKLLTTLSRARASSEARSYLNQAKKYYRSGNDKLIGRDYQGAIDDFTIAIGIHTTVVPKQN